MRQGPAPIYVCLYLLVRAEEVAVFKEDTYRPYLNAADISPLVAPDLYVLKRFVSIISNGKYLMPIKES